MLVKTSQLPDNSDLAGIRLFGQVAGNAFVSNGNASIHGQIAGNLTVHAGAHATIFGQVCGDLRIYGVVELHGWVLGKVHEFEGSSITVYPESKIGLL